MSVKWLVIVFLSFCIALLGEKMRPMVVSYADEPFYEKAFCLELDMFMALTTVFLSLSIVAEDYRLLVFTAVGFLRIYLVLFVLLDRCIKKQVSENLDRLIEMMIDEEPDYEAERTIIERKDRWVVSRFDQKDRFACVFEPDAAKNDRWNVEIRGPEGERAKVRIEPELEDCIYSLSLTRGDYTYVLKAFVFVNRSKIEIYMGYVLVATIKTQTAFDGFRDNNRYNIWCKRSELVSERRDSQ